MTEAQGRAVWFTDRWGREVDDDVTTERFAALIDELAQGDDAEHASVSATDEREWNLDVTGGRLLFENLGEGEVGVIRDVDRATTLAILDEFLADDLDAVRRRPWE